MHLWIVALAVIAETVLIVSITTTIRRRRIENEWAPSIRYQTTPFGIVATVRGLGVQVVASNFKEARIKLLDAISDHFEE